MTNRGNTTASLRDIMSLFATAGGDNIDGSQVDLGTARVSGKLKPGQSRTIKANVTPPATLLSGTTLTPGATLTVNGDPNTANNTIFSTDPISVLYPGGLAAHLVSGGTSTTPAAFS